MFKRNKENLTEPKAFTKKGEPLGKLSTSNKIKKWVIGKPKLAASVPSDPTSPKIEKLNIPAITFRLILLALIMTFIVVFAMWIILGLTILPTVRAGNSTFLVSTTSWTQGSAPDDTYVMVLPKPVERSILSRAIMLVNSDPTGENSVFVVKGKNKTGGYIAECYTGYCKNNKSVAKNAHALINVPANNVLGEVKKELTITGFKGLPQS